MKAASRSERGRDGLLLVLTGAAGCADAIAFLALGHVFTANMSGNTALLGLYLAQMDGAGALRSLIALAGFAAGLAIGARMVDRPGSAGPWPAAVTRALAAEALILAAVAVGAYATGPSRGVPAGRVLIALSALAMGMQSAAVWRLGVPGISTTYLTGTLTSAVTGFVSRSQPGTSRTPPPVPAEEGQTSRDVRWRKARLQFLALGVYGLGAAIGGLVHLRVPGLVSALPLAAVAAVVVAAPGLTGTPRRV